MTNKILMLLLCCTLGSFAQDYKKDLSDIEAAANGYIDIFYKGDTLLAYKHIDKSLRKVGWRYNGDKQVYSSNLELPFDAVIDLSKQLKKNPIPGVDSAPREVEILEANDKIAVVKVTAIWGIDYLNMVKFGADWKIINIVWQSAPKWTYRPGQ